MMLQDSECTKTKISNVPCTVKGIDGNEYKAIPYESWRDAFMNALPELREVIKWGFYMFNLLRASMW